MKSRSTLPSTQRYKVTPDQETFEAHVAEDDFRNGVVLGQWDIHPVEGVVWPNSVMWIGAAPKAKSPDRFYLRFTLDGYPNQAPSAYFCIETGDKAPEGKWPTGINDVAMAFCVNNWEHRNAFYAPWDRAGLRAHPEWKDQYKGNAWENSFTISHYLNQVFNLLHSDDYKGTVEAGNS